MAKLFSGTSGFAYAAWRPGFYPEGTPEAKFLPVYAQRLNCCEINYTFRRTPTEATLRKWIDCTPAGFVFAIKAHFRITHGQRLQNAGDATQWFLNALNPLAVEKRLGPLLFQLPPNMKADPPRLATFLELLPRHLRSAFEFRHQSWFTDEIYDILKRHNICLCLAESEKLEVPPVITADFVYHRLRKPGYTEDNLREMAVHAGHMLSEGRDVYMVFKHEESPEGPLNAERMLKLLEE